MALEIPQIADLLKGYLDGEIVGQKVSRLTAPGENYGSLMLKVDITVKNNDKEEIIHAVAKCVPPNKKIQEIFNTQTTFLNEIGWYKEAIPALKEFQKEQGIKEANFFMKIFGARSSLDPANLEVDEGGVILCENLIAKGFKNADRRLGFTLIESQELLKALAAFHAVTIALKLKKPEVFNDKVKRYVYTLSNAEKRFEIFAEMLQILQENMETSSLASRVLDAIKNGISAFTKEPEYREPWATSIHTDFWVNNMMLREKPEAKPEVIILDLQTCGYGSPVADLVFFLGTSVQNPIGEKYFDDLIKLYHETFVQHLKELNVDTTPFCYENFQRELDLEAPTQYVHILFFIAVILAVKGQVTDVTKKEFHPEEELMKMFKNLTQEHKEKLVYITKEFAKRNWI